MAQRHLEHDGWMEEMNDEADHQEDTFTKSLSGASKTCNYCGTIFDLHGVDAFELLPPVGGGCEYCMPE